jgi:hypothetical protein
MYDRVLLDKNVLGAGAELLLLSGADIPINQSINLLGVISEREG